MRAKSKQLKDRERAKNRALAKEQQREAKKLIISESYSDQLKREIVCRSTTASILSQLSVKFGEVVVGAVPTVEKGLVLSNDYGHGVWQDAPWWR
jgi:hypothetical protein